MKELSCQELVGRCDAIAPYGYHYAEAGSRELGAQGDFTTSCQ